MVELSSALVIGGSEEEFSAELGSVIAPEASISEVAEVAVVEVTAVGCELVLFVVVGALLDAGVGCDVVGTGLLDVAGDEVLWGVLEVFGAALVVVTGTLELAGGSAGAVPSSEAHAESARVETRAVNQGDEQRELDMS